MLVTEDTGAADKGPICLRPASKTKDQAWRSWKSYSATCSIYTTQACTVRKSVYSLPVDRVSAFQEFPGGQRRRSGSTAPGQGRQEQRDWVMAAAVCPSFSITCFSVLLLFKLSLRNDSEGAAKVTQREVLSAS